MTATTFKDNIGKEDIRQFGGNNRTFQRRNSAGALLTLHSVGNVVDVLQAFGDGSTPAHSDLTDAIVGANGNEVTFELAPGTWPITSDLTIPSTVTVHLLRGAAFSVSAGVTLTLSGPVIAQESTWYSGAGTVVYTAGGGFFPLVSDLASVAAGKGASLIGATGTAKTVGDLFDGGKDVDIKPLNVDAGGTLAVAGATTLATTLAVTGATTLTGDAAAVNLSASGTLGGKLAFRGALAYLGANQSINDSSITVISFTSESYDTSAIHDNSTNPSRLTVPAGVTRVKLITQVEFAGNASGYRSIFIYKNGGSYQGEPQVVVAPQATANRIQAVSAALTVVAGDYFEVNVYQTSGGPLNAIGGGNGDNTWFAMEIIE